MMNSTNVHTEKCIGWGAILAGALVAVGLTFLLNLFSVAIGLKAFSADTNGEQILVFGGLLGTSIGMVAAMFASGWLTGYLSRPHCEKRHIGALYGFLAWCVALIIGILLTGYVQQYLSFYGQFLSGNAGVIQISNTASGNSASVAVSNVSDNALVISTYIIFSLFFLSAFASSLGGHLGMRHRCNE